MPFDFACDSSRPGYKAKLLALLAFTAWVFILCTIGATSFVWRSSLAQERLFLAVTSNNFSQAKELIEVVLKAPLLEGVYTKVNRELDLAENREQNLAAAINYLDVLGNVKDKNFSTALGQVRTAPLVLAYPRIHFTWPPGQVISFPPNALSAQYRRDLNDSLEDLINLNAEIARYTKVISQYQEELTRIQKLHKLVADEASKLFSLPSQYETENKSSNSPLALFYYQAGVLKDVPTLRGVADNLPDLETLRTQLDQAGGRVTLEGPNIVSQFADKLRELQQASATIISDFNSSLELQEEAKAQYKAAKEAWTQKYSLADKLSRNLILLACGAKQTDAISTDQISG
jgi:hypothetical protein